MVERGFCGLDEGNRPRYDRHGQRYPSDLTNEEWIVLEPFLPVARGIGLSRRHTLRETMNGIRYVLRYGIPWMVSTAADGSLIVRGKLEGWSVEKIASRAIDVAPFSLALLDKTSIWLEKLSNPNLVTRFALFLTPGKIKSSRLCVPCAPKLERKTRSSYITLDMVI
ncbi:hypothetical protein CCP2SC5_370008 [Azospirillaceae bacterium]